MSTNYAYSLRAIFSVKPLSKVQDHCIVARRIKYNECVRTFLKEKYIVLCKLLHIHAVAMFLKCLFYFFKCVGIAPMSIKALIAKKSKTCDFLFVPSRPGIFYNSILLCLLMFVSYFSIEYTINKSYTYRSHLEIILDVACAIVEAITSIVILIQISINKDKAVTIVNKLIIIYQKQKIEFGRKSQSILLLRSVKTIVFISFFLIFLCCVTLGVNYHSDLVYVPSFTIFYCTMLQYTLILKLLCYFYRFINTELQSVLRSEVPIIFISRNNTFFDMEFQRISNKIKQLREIHVLLSQLSQDASDLYALPMLFCITNKFLALLAGCYASMLPNMQGTGIRYEDVLFLLPFLVLEIFTVTILGRAAGLTVTESKRTGKIVGESIAYCPNELALNQLNRFKNYLSQLEVNFSVFNLFLINESLLTSIASYITTYMVILIQFKENNYSSNCAELKDNATSIKFVN